MHFSVDKNSLISLPMETSSTVLGWLEQGEEVMMRHFLI